VVTGGAGLFGRQIVQALVESHATVFVASRNLESLHALARDLAPCGPAVTPLDFDQGDENSVLSLRDRVVDAVGRVDVLVNNAVLRPMKQGYEDSVDTFMESMRVNAAGLFAVTRAFGDVMAAQERGSIINIGSIQGMIGPDPALYRGTSLHGWYPDYFFHKGGMINFTRFVASYYGASSVRCNCISPGGFQTPNHPAEFVHQYSGRTFLGRMANATDLMGAVVFLASDASAYVTGTNLPVDGGYTAK
jgi:NAD(P)-dependent dehydrogenase (short-subunit alcohol dehydrogenase family)